eukprot:1235165-Amphidinium_carterae.1
MSSTRTAVLPLTLTGDFDQSDRRFANGKRRTTYPSSDGLIWGFDFQSGGQFRKKLSEHLLLEGVQKKWCPLFEQQTISTGEKIPTRLRLGDLDAC